MKFTRSFFILTVINVFALVAMENSELELETQPQNQLSLNDHCKNLMVLRLNRDSFLIDFRQLKLSNLYIEDLAQDICTLYTIEEAKTKEGNKLIQSPNILAAIMLTKLNLSDNALTSLPSSFTTLQNLKEINLSGNKFKEFPDVLWLSSQPELIKINLCNNKIEQLPTTASNLKLKKLDIAHNKLIKIPESFTSLKNLEKIDVSFNNLTAFPEVLCSMANLTMIDLDDNQIPEIPSAISNLTKLKKFYVRRNNITNIPEQMEEYVRVFKIEGNPFANTQKE